MLSYCGLLAVGLLGLHPDFGVLKTNSQIRFAHKKMGQLAGAIAVATGATIIEPRNFEFCLFSGHGLNA
jgi:hypothetical protein